MSTLLMDFGNSRLKWRCHDEVVQAPAVQAIAHEGRPADAIAALAQQWQGGKPEAVCIAQVLGAAHESTINSAIEQAFGLAPRYARSVADCRLDPATGRGSARCRWQSSRLAASAPLP